MLKPRVTYWMCFRLYKVLEEPVYIQSGEEKYKTGLQLGKFKLIYLITVSGSFSFTFQFFLRFEPVWKQRSTVPVNGRKKPDFQK
jgi:hypothetical protein